MYSFDRWYDNADMPEQDENGNWYDLEDGIYFYDGADKPKIKFLTALDKEKIALDEKIAEFKKRDWKEVSIEEKKEFYSWNEERRALDKKRASMKKLTGDTYHVKEEIKLKGGKWNAKNKFWSVPSECYDELFALMKK